MLWVGFCFGFVAGQVYWLFAWRKKNGELQHELRKVIAIYRIGIARFIENNP